MPAHSLPSHPSAAPDLVTLISYQLGTQPNTWMPFDEFMSLALYHPQWGYYTSAQRPIGLTRTTGSDFATAPVISPYFGQTLAAQVAQALEDFDTTEVWEFGAGTGALAQQLLQKLGERITRYTIVDLSGTLQATQAQTLSEFPHKVRWLSQLPEALEGVVIGNEVLDAMPVKLLQRTRNVWHERGVVLHENQLCFADTPSSLRPPVEILGTHDYLTEICPQAEAFIGTLADKLRHGLTQGLRGGAIFLMDYGFTDSEYYHPARHMGTLMCHQAHQSDSQPLLDVGKKDMTAHVDFTRIALASQNADLHVNGYTTQGRFLLNCGLLDLLRDASLAERTMAQKLITEHEMGELFKVLCLSTKPDFEPIGFLTGDRTHTL